MNAVTSSKLRERFAEIRGVAQEYGTEFARHLQSGVLALAMRMGAVTLGAAVLVWITWFLLPAAGISGGGENIAAFSFRTLLGTNLADQSSLYDPGHARALLRYLGLLAIAVPFAVPFIRTTWSRFLNAAPLAIVLVGWLVIHENVASGLGQLGPDNPFSFKWGFYLLLIACLVLASSVLKKRAA